MYSGVSDEKEMIFKKFEALLTDCYSGNLKSFCQDFRQNDDSFYRKIQKSRLRIKTQDVSNRTLDDFKKYIFFLEYKKLELEKKDASFRVLDKKFDAIIRCISK